MKDTILSASCPLRFWFHSKENQDALCSFSSCVIIRNCPCRLKTNVLFTEIISIIHSFGLKLVLPQSLPISAERLVSLLSCFTALFCYSSAHTSSHPELLQNQGAYNEFINQCFWSLDVGKSHPCTSSHHRCAYHHFKLVCQPATHLSCCFFLCQHHIPCEKSQIMVCSKVHIPFSQNNHLVLLPTSIDFFPSKTPEQIDVSNSRFCILYQPVFIPVSSFY